MLESPFAQDSILEPGPAEPLGYLCPPTSFSILLSGSNVFLRNNCWEESGKGLEAVMVEQSQEGR